MDPLHDERRSADAAPGGFRRRFEKKYFIAPHDVHSALAFLRHTCVPDRVHPRGGITSLYFDSADLVEYERSLAGEIGRRKIRIRWYDDITGDHPVQVFLELKMRWGAASGKRRQRHVIPARHLQPAGLRAGILRPALFLESLARLGHFPSQPLRPVVTVSYDRYRFVDSFTGVRVSLDHHLRSTVVARDVGLGERSLPMGGVIVEVKGPTANLPRTLLGLRTLGTDWTRFSKYGQAVDSHVEKGGSVGRLWPSGRNGTEQWMS